MGMKLSLQDVLGLADDFFVMGTLKRMEFGAAPTIQFNEHQTTSVVVDNDLEDDIRVLSDVAGIGFFPYGPRLWMLGDVEPLKALQDAQRRPEVLTRILSEYPDRTLFEEESFYRLRKNPSEPAEHREYDAPPAEYVGNGRLGTEHVPTLYGSQDIDVCIHECRVAAEDETYVATLTPTRDLRLLDLTHLLQEETTEFESLDMAVHMLFMAGSVAYPLTQSIAEAASHAGFDGLVYPSYFSVLRTGSRPFATVLGISVRRFPSLRQAVEEEAIRNLALFGRPIADGKVRVLSINRLVLRRVHYEYHFGPAKS